MKYFSPATSTAILRCPRASFRIVWAALAYISSVPMTGSGSGTKSGAGPGGEGRRGCVIRVVRVSGTMRKAEEEAIRRARREVVRVRGVEGGLVDGLVGLDGGGGGQVMDVDVDEEEEEDGEDDDV